MNRPTIPVVDQIRTGLVDGIERYEHGRRRRRRAVSVVASVAVLLAVAAGVVLRDTGDDDGGRVIVGTDGPGPLPGLHEMPAPPAGLRLSAEGLRILSPVWTGTELLVVGTTEDPAIVDARTPVALSFDPGTRRWRQLPRPPLDDASGWATAWTGDELVVCCGGFPEESSSAAAYDPDTDTWRSLPDAPVHGAAAAEWTGDRVVVVATSGAASFDPASDEWSALPAPPGTGSFPRTAWSGEELYAWPAPATRTVATGAVLDPASGEWSSLPAPAAGSWPAAPDLVWIDDSLVVLGGLPAAMADYSERFVGARYDPATGAWSPLPEPLPEPESCECNLGSQASLWTGRDLLVFVGALASGTSAEGVLLAYDPATDAWRTVGDTSETALVPIATLGDRVLLGRGGELYLSDPDWRPAPAASARPAACAAARHPWQVGPASGDEPADGLPPSGTATQALADRVLREQERTLLDEYGALSAGVRVDDGRAWRRDGDGAIEIVDERIATIVLLLDDADACPAAPVFGPDGVPLSFEVRGG